MMQNIIVRHYSVAYYYYFFYIGMAGLAVTYGLNLNARLSRWILSFCKLENKIISIERIYQYSQIPSEAPAIIEDSRPPSSWPVNGAIEIFDLKVLI
jgi:hypothetical protein